MENKDANMKLKSIRMSLIWSYGHNFKQLIDAKGNGDRMGIIRSYNRLLDLAMDLSLWFDFDYAKMFKCVSREAER